MFPFFKLIMCEQSKTAVFRKRMLLARVTFNAIVVLMKLAKRA